MQRGSRSGPLTQSEGAGLGFGEEPRNKSRAQGLQEHVQWDAGRLAAFSLVSPAAQWGGSGVPGRLPWQEQGEGRCPCRSVAGARAQTRQWQKPHLVGYGGLEESGAAVSGAEILSALVARGREGGFPSRHKLGLLCRGVPRPLGA